MSTSDLQPHATDVAPNGRAPGTPPAGALLDRVVELASRPLAEAEALPGAVYHDPAFHALEVDRIFRREWLYVGRAEQVAEPGQYIAVDLVDEPVIVLRGTDGELRAMSRVCLHRFSDMLGTEAEACGTLERFECPYHNWAYAFDGSLAGAPHMPRNTRFQRERDGYRLPQFSVEVWQGFVFVNLDPDAAPLAPRLREAEEVLDGYDLDAWVLVDTIEWGETDVNWKLVMENGRECYHHQGTHRNTLEPMWPTRDVVTETTDSRDWFYQRMMVTPEAAIGEEDGHHLTPLLLPEPAPGLSAYQRSHFLLVGVYPTFFFAPGPDIVAAFRVLPTGPESHQLDIHVLVHPTATTDPELAAHLAGVREFLTLVQQEDANQLQLVVRALRSGVADRGGALSHLERPIWQLQRFLADRLAGRQL